ncbi:MAG: helix-turn-helix transcriptional regulator [Bacteroidales bacterium]|nr:helix-turn-helix transcriptional regulator [Bacteroidales bacterium]
MKFCTKSNIVPLFKGIITSISPFALSNQVKLTFISGFEQMILIYNPAQIIHDVTELLCNVIAFTPQNYSVETKLSELKKNSEFFLYYEVQNDGADLSKIKEITKGLHYECSVSSPKVRKTLYCLRISEFEPDEKNIDGYAYKQNAQVPEMYAKVQKKLQFYFRNIQSIEKSAAAKSHQQGVFIQKLNTIIQTNLDQEEFCICQLCDGLALSRSQLYRKMKKITHLSPANYIQFYRLQKAKELLQNTDMNVSEVVYSVGFSSHSHFTRAFNNQFGINPSLLKK